MKKLIMKIKALLWWSRLDELDRKMACERITFNFKTVLHNTELIAWVWKRNKEMDMLE